MALRNTKEKENKLKPVLRNKVNFVARQNYVTQNTDCEWLKRFLVRTFIFILAFHQTITKNKLETFECETIVESCVEFDCTNYTKFK